MENNQTNNVSHSKKTQKPKLNLFKLIRNIVIVIILLLLAIFILDKAPNYKNREITDKTNLIINNKNVTSFLKKNLLIKDNIVYLSKQDITNFFDPYLYYNEKEERIIITCDTKVTNMFLNNSSITINDENKNIVATAFVENDVIYLPISELQESFNVELKFSESTDIAIIDTLSKEQITVNPTKNISIKAVKDTFSRNVAKAKKTDTLVLIENLENNWSKVRTLDGKIGYVKNSNLTNETKVRENQVAKPQVEGKINMVWDYYTEYQEAPDRTGTSIKGVNVISPTFFTMANSTDGIVMDKAGSAGSRYINWAKSNNYKVWALVANDNLSIKETSSILNNYEARNNTIKNIVRLATNYELDGINIDFECMYEDDKDIFTQFIVELYPRLKEKNIVLSVNVTAPDGGENWSMCYDRKAIADNSDYVIFMAYDQYGISSTKPGTTAGYDWILVNTNKFLKEGGVDEVPAEKLVLALPFFSRVWTQDASGKIVKTNGTIPVATMKNVYRLIPENVKINWLDDLRQNYAEWTVENNTKKIWIEDEKSIREKLSIITDKNLAGAAFWVKDRETDDVWDMIAENLK